MKGFIKLLSLGLVIGVLLACVVACGSNENSEENSKNNKTESVEKVTPGPADESTPTPTEVALPTDAVPTDEQTPAPTDKPTPTEEPTPTPQRAESLCEKVVSVDMAGKKIENYIGLGFSYSENGKYGYVAASGTDTGAAFTFIKSLMNNGPIIVSSKESNGADEALEDINRYGLLSKEGKVLIPEEYAVFDYLSERYVVAMKATDVTTSEEECMIFAHSYASRYEVSVHQPQDGDVMYKGEWTLFDIIKGQSVPGASGTNPRVRIRAGVGLASFTTDDGVEHKVNSNGGEIIGRSIEYCYNGRYADYYIVNEEDKGSVYRPDGTLLFTYDPNAYKVIYCEGDFGSFFAEKTSGNSKTYVLLDENGKEKSVEFAKPEDAFGDCVIVDGALYRTDGTKVADKCSVFIADNTFNRGVFFKSFSAERQTYTYYFVEFNGNVVATLEDAENAHVYEKGKFILYNSTEDGNGYRYYNYSEKAFSIAADTWGSSSLLYEPVESYLVFVINADGQKDLVDVFTGKVIVKGYDSYQAFVMENSIYIVAKSGNDVDLFKYDGR